MCLGLRLGREHVRTCSRPVLGPRARADANARCNAAVRTPKQAAPPQQLSETFSKRHGNMKTLENLVEQDVFLKLETWLNNLFSKIFRLGNSEHQSEHP